MTDTAKYEVEISIFGAKSGWRRTIVTRVIIDADSREDAVSKILAREDFPNLTAEDIFSVGLA